MNLIEAVGAYVFQGWIRIEEFNRRRPTVEASHPDYAVFKRTNNPTRAEE